MKKIATCTILALSAALAGCNSPAGYANRSLESIHQPVVSSSVHHLDIAAYGGAIAPSESTRLQQWFDAIGLRYGDQIVIQDASAYGSPAAVQTVRAMLAPHGATLAGVAEDSSGTVGDGNLRITVIRATAMVPGCPDWSTRFQADPYNATSSNYGCAINSNLAAMVADPNDLIRGVSTSDQNSAAGVKAIKSYREKPPTGAGELRSNQTNEGGGK